MRKLLVGTAILVLVLALSACQQETKTVTKEPVIKLEGGQMTLEQLGKAQPGLGVLMTRIGRRFTTAYYAAKAGKWELTTYEFEEMKEDLETGGITRPKRKAALDKFLGGSALAELEKAAKDKDGVAFGAAFDNTVKACNNCHDSADKKFIIYALPDTAPDLPSLK